MAPTLAPTAFPSSSPTQLLDSLYLSNFKSTTMFTSLLGWVVPGLFFIGFCCFFPVIMKYLNNRAMITEAKINEHFMQKREEYRMKSPDDIKYERSSAMKDQFMMRFGYDPENASNNSILDSPKRTPVSKNNNYNNYNDHFESPHR